MVTHLGLSIQMGLNPSVKKSKKGQPWTYNLAIKKGYTAKAHFLGNLLNGDNEDDGVKQIRPKKRNFGRLFNRV